MRRGLGLVAMGLVLGTGEVPAQTDTLWVRGGVAGAGDTLMAEVVLKNLSPISGAAWTVGFEKGTMTPLEVEPAERTETMEAYSHTADDSLRVLMLDPALGSAVPPGEGTIARMRFLIDSEARIGVYPLRLIQADLGDDAHPPGRIEPIRIDGEVKVTGFVARMEQAMGLPGDTVAVALVLENSEPAAGLQVELAWDGEVLAFVDAASGGRGGDLTAYGRSRQAGQATVLLTDLSGTSLLPAGAGAVLHVRLRIFDRAAVGEVPLRIARALLPDAEGVALPIVARAGKIEVMFRPNRSPELLLPETVFAIEDSGFIWPIPASDSDGDVLTFSLASAPGWVGLDADADRLTGTPADADVGVHEVRIRVSDGEAETEGTVRIEVLNRAPEIVGVPPLRARVGKTCRYAPQVRNLDGGQVRIEAEAEGVRLDASTGAFLWTPTRTGDFLFSLIASDPHGAEAVQTFTLSVEARPRVVIDEILADPPSGPEGDANGDGLRDSKADEFVEVLNLGAEAVNIGGWTLSDDDVSEVRRFRFPEGTVLESLERAVLFGGGEPLGVAGLVFVDDGSIGNGLTNSGDVVLLIDPAFEDTVAYVDYQVEGDVNVSLARQASGAYVPHDAFPGSGRFSPGLPRPLLERLALNAPNSLHVGARGVVKAIAYYSNSTHREVTEEVSWHVDSAHLKVGENGALTGVSVGRAEISGTWYTAVAKQEIVVIDRPNQAPVVTPVFPQTALEDSVFQMHLAASDPDEDTLSFRKVSGPAWLSVHRTGSVRGRPADADVGEARVVVAVTDGRVRLETAFEIKVLNRPPRIVGVPPLRARVGKACRYAPQVRNLDGGQVRIEAEAEGVRLDASTGAFLWTPTRTGDFLFSLIASDPHGAEAVQTFTLSVEARPRVVIDEILADPPSGPEGDANGDGLRDSKADEFVEVLNLGAEAVNIGGWTLSDDDVSEVRRFRFPEGTVLESLERAVLFGGGEPLGVAGLVFVDDGSIGNGLTNSGDVVLLIDPAFEDTVAKAEYRVEGDLNQSLVRDSTRWVGHAEPPGIGLFSPGRPRETAASPTKRPPGRRPEGVVINEILANPPSGAAGDANGDGVRHGFEDEFVELWNSGTEPADLSGWRLGDDDVGPDRLFQFPENSLLPVGGYVTLFGGGSPQGVAGGVVVDDGRIGDGLSNAGDRVVLVSADGVDTLQVVGFGKGRPGISWVRGRDGTLVEHDRLPGKGAFSPGYPRPELTGLRLLPDSLRLTPGTEGTFQAFGGFSDSTEVDLTAWVRWTVEDSAVAKVDSTGTVRGVAGGSTGLTAYWGEHIAALARVAVGPTREEADSLAVTDSTGVSARDSAGHGPNRPPEILSLPDTIAVVGLRYRYRPRAEDPDGDPVSLHAPVRPDWLALDGETLEGTPLPGDVGNPEVVVEAGDGQDRSEQRFRIRVLEPEGLLGGAPDSLAFVGLTWRWPFVLKGDFEVQVEGGPVLARSGRVLVWRPRPEDEGERIVAVSVSGNSFEEQVVAYRVFVLPHPHLQVTEVLVDPPQDVDGDGVVDALKDQFVELFNAGGHPMDLSGWSLGDDDGAPFRFPVGSVIRPQGLFTLFGGGTTDIDAGRFSAGGRIGNGLAGSDRILLIAPAGPDTLIDTGYSGGKVGASLVPDPRREGQWVAHTAVSNRRFSPGTVEAVVPTEADTSEAHPAGADTLISADADTSSPFELPTPNPFNRNTRVGFRTDGGEIRLTVFSILGQPVRQLVREAFPPGRHQVVWDGRDDAGRPAGSGVYLIRIETGQTTHTMRVLLLR